MEYASWLDILFRMNAELTPMMTVLLCVGLVSLALIVIAFMVCATFGMNPDHRSFEYRYLTGEVPPREKVNWQPLVNGVQRATRALRKTSNRQGQERQQGDAGTAQQTG